MCLCSSAWYRPKAFGIEEIIPPPARALYLIILIVLKPFVWARALPSVAPLPRPTAILPREGGIYAWSKETFGEFGAFRPAGGLHGHYISSGAYIAMAGGYTRSCLLDDAGTFGVKLLVGRASPSSTWWDL